MCNKNQNNNNSAPDEALVYQDALCLQDAQTLL